MKLLVRLGILLAIVAALIGPGRDYTAFAWWWATNGQPPEATLAAPAGAVRGAVEIGLETRPSGRVELLSADVDGRPLPLEEPLRLDTASLPDGDHLVTVHVQDRSFRHNPGQATLRLASDNTPPTFRIQPAPPSVAQGHSTVIYVQPSEPADLQLNVNGTPLRLFPAGNDYWALLGIDADEKPGSLELSVEGRDRVGNTGRTTGRLEVKTFAFTQYRLTVPAPMLPLLQPAVRTGEDERLGTVYKRENGPPLWKGPFLLPVLGPISTEFGEVRSYNGGPFQGHHGGTDFQAAGGAPVQAAARGRVAFRDEVRLRGRVLILDHGGGVYTTYAHLSEWLVDLDQEVQAAQPIAKVGSTGLSTGPHLHWELWVNGINVNPMEWTEREVP